MKIALWLHLLGVVVWVGGMFFAYMALRPAAIKLLEPAQRLPLWAAVFTHFFPWVWASIGMILASGLYMFFQMSSFSTKPQPHVHIMLMLSTIMMLIFGHVYFASFRKLKRYVALKDWPKAGAALNKIRFLVGMNLLLGLIVITVATAGSVWF